MSGFIGTVTTESQLNNDISLVDGTTVAGIYTITVSGSIADTADLTAINLDIANNVSLVIDGINGGTLDGGGLHRGLFDFNGALTVNNLTISNMLAQGGAGGYAGSHAGGGGAGLGGGLFVAGTNIISGTTYSGGTVTLDGVSFSGNKASGGTGGTDGGSEHTSGPYAGDFAGGGYGGGGGMGGAGGAAGGLYIGAGGGIGSGATGGGFGTSNGSSVMLASGPGIVQDAKSGGSGSARYFLTSPTTVVEAGGSNGGGGGGYAPGTTTPPGSPYGTGYGAAGGGGIGGKSGVGSNGAPGAGASSGGAGGFGGGGGGAAGAYHDSGGGGGTGGFGGGGGGGYWAAGGGGWGGGGGGGVGGFGAGSGGGRSGLVYSTNYTLRPFHNSGGSGGGGLGAGGDIFVQQGGVLIIGGAGSLGVGTVAAGAAGALGNNAPGYLAGTAGSAFGNGLFIQNSSTTVTQFITLSPGNGNTLIVTGQVADQAGSLGDVGNSNSLATEGGLVITGGGKVVLQSATADDYTGGTKLQGNTVLVLNAGTAAGSGAITFGGGHDKLVIQSVAMSGSNFANTVSGFVAGDVIDLAGLAFISGASATIAAGSTLLKVTSGTITDTLTVGGNPSGFSVVQDTGTGSAVMINTFTVTSLTDLNSDLAAINVGGVDSFSGANYTFDFVSSFTLGSTETIDLANNATLSLSGTGFTTGGGYDLVAGTVVAGAIGAIGTGNITVGNTANLNLGTFNQTIGDLSGGGAVILGSGATLTEGTSNSTLFSGVINGSSGDFVKQGGGTLSLTANGSSLSLVTINAGIVQLGTGGTTGSLSGSIVDDATLAIDLGVGTTLSNTISGTGVLLQSGSGTITLTGTDSYDGATTIQAGGLQIGGGGTVGSIANTASVTGSGKLIFDRSDSVVFGQLITGSVALVQAGSGTTALTGTDNYSGGTTIQAGTLQIGNGGTTGAISGNINDNATLAVDESGTVTIAGTISGGGAVVQAGSGTTILDANNIFGGGLTLNGGEVILGSAGAAGGGTITFGTGTIFAFNGSAAPLNVVSSMQTTDTIDVTNVVVTSATLVNTNTIQINLASGGPIDVTLDPTQNYSTVFAHSATAGTDNFITLDTTPCFLRGTHILTPYGEVPVECLAVGDRVVTQSGNTQPITWIGTGRVLATRGRRNAATPVIVKKSALAPNVPMRDLRVTKGHSLLIDNVLIPVEELINHRTILWDDRAQEVLIYHIELATHDVLLADGAPAESYRDDGNRWLFQNANTGWNQAPKPPCAPVLAGGPIVDAAWRRFLERAGPRPGLPLTDDPDLHLLVNGHRQDAIARHDGVHRFHLTRLPEHVRIVSRSGVPQELGVARDPRLLGVALHKIMLRHSACDRLLAAEDATLCDGFHDFETNIGFRWTDGNAAIPRALFAGANGSLMLELHVGAVAQYVLEDEARAVA